MASRVEVVEKRATVAGLKGRADEREAVMGLLLRSRAVMGLALAIALVVCVCDGGKGIKTLQRQRAREVARSIQYIGLSSCVLHLDGVAAPGVKGQGRNINLSTNEKPTICKPGS